MTTSIFEEGLALLRQSELHNLQPRTQASACIAWAYACRLFKVDSNEPPASNPNGLCRPNLILGLARYCAHEDYGDDGIHYSLVCDKANGAAYSSSTYDAECVSLATLAQGSQRALLIRAVERTLKSISDSAEPSSPCFLSYCTLAFLMAYPKFWDDVTSFHQLVEKTRLTLSTCVDICSPPF